MPAIVGIVSRKCGRNVWRLEAVRNELRRPKGRREASYVRRHSVENVRIRARGLKAVKSGERGGVAVRPREILFQQQLLVIALVLTVHEPINVSIVHQVHH